MLSRKTGSPDCLDVALSQRSSLLVQEGGGTLGEEWQAGPRYRAYGGRNDACSREIYHKARLDSYLAWLSRVPVAGWALALGASSSLGGFMLSGPVGIPAVLAPDTSSCSLWWSNCSSDLTLQSLLFLISVL